MNDGRLSVPVKTATVEISATLKSGAEVSQDLPIQYPEGSTDGQILGYAISVFRGVGSIVVDKDGGVDCYYVNQFEGPLRFRIKKIVLADPAVKL